MDTENIGKTSEVPRTNVSNSSSFEDLSLSNDLKESGDNSPVTNTDKKEQKAHDDVMDIIGTGQLTKKVSLRSSYCHRSFKRFLPFEGTDRRRLRY